MPKMIIDSDTLTDISDAIRDKTGKEDLLNPKDIINEINNINGLHEIAFKRWMKYFYDGITTIKIPDGIRKLRNGLFALIGKLESVYFPDTLESIGDYTFYFTGLHDVDLSNTKLTSIGDWTFYGCDELRKIKFPETLEYIGVGAFMEAHLIIDDPPGSNNKSYDIFSYTKLKSIDTRAFYNSRRDNMLIYNIRFPDTLESIGDFAFYGCKIFNDIDLSNTKLTSIGNYAFSNTIITDTNGNPNYNSNSIFYKIKFPETLEYIGYDVFLYSPFKEFDLSKTKIKNMDRFLSSSSEWWRIANFLDINIIFPETLESINYEAFVNCAHALTTVDLSNTKITSIDWDGESTYAFAVSTLKLPNSLTSLPKLNGFENLTTIDLSNTKITRLEPLKLPKRIHKVVFPPTLTLIDNSAFTECNELTTVDLSNTNIINLDVNIFKYNTSITTIKLPYSLIRITTNGANQSYLSSTLSSIEIPEWGPLTLIDNFAFQGCTKLTEIKFPYGLTKIGDYAFSGCTKLTEIKFPYGLTSIGNSAFSGCTNLKTINVPWASGAVPGAPWGATNATINYNVW